MEKKYLNKILIISLIIIWGLLIFKYITPYFKKDQIVIPLSSKPIESKFFLFKKDTFDLVLSGKDPFLGKRELKVVSKASRVSRKAIRNVNTVVNWPKITYLGFVKSNSNTTRLGLLRVDNVLKRVRDREHVQGLEILKIYEDSVQVRFNSENRFVLKSR